jgi:hypothetical protein
VNNGRGRGRKAPRISFDMMVEEVEVEVKEGYAMFRREDNE